MDPRIKDVLLAMPKRLDLFQAKIDALEQKVREDNAYIKETLRSIKKSVVRKYGAGDELPDPDDIKKDGEKVSDNGTPGKSLNHSN